MENRRHKLKHVLLGAASLGLCSLYASAAFAQVNEVTATTAPNELLDASDGASPELPESYIFAPGVSTTATGGIDTVIDWAPGDTIDLSDLNLASDFFQLSDNNTVRIQGTRLKLIQGFGADDFQLKVEMNGYGQQSILDSIAYVSTPPPPPPPPPPAGNYNVVSATSTANELLDASDGPRPELSESYVFAPGTSTSATGGIDTVMDWAPGDEIDLSALGLAPEFFQLSDNNTVRMQGTRVKLIQGFGSEDFQLKVNLNGYAEQSILDSIVYDQGGTDPDPELPGEVLTRNRKYLDFERATMNMNEVSNQFNAFVDGNAEEMNAGEGAHTTIAVKEDPYTTNPVGASVPDCSMPEDRYKQECFDMANKHAKFRIKCEFSHLNYDDAILNKNGNAHLHMYFGNTQADGDSTYESLLNTGNSTCAGGELNRTSYWVPALIDQNGNALIPSEIMVYYKNRDANHQNYVGNTHTGDSHIYPPELKMIARQDPPSLIENHDLGEASLNTGLNPIVGFACGERYKPSSYKYEESKKGDYTREILPCTGRRGVDDKPGQEKALEMRIRFPQCYKGNETEYQLAYRRGVSSNGEPLGFAGKSCQDSSYTKLPSLEYRIFWYVKDHPVLASSEDVDYAITNVKLSSDATNQTAGHSGHADWYGAWSDDVQSMWVRNCNNENLNQDSYNPYEETVWDCEAGVLRRGKTGAYIETVTRGNNKQVPVHECDGCVALHPRDDYQGPFVISAAEIREELCSGSDLDFDGDLREQISTCGSHN